MDGSQTNSHKKRNKHMEILQYFVLLGITYGMTLQLVDIVDNYSAFVIKEA